MSAGHKLERKWEQAISALLTSRTHAEAAEAAGISEATLTRWLKEPAFQSAYRDARRQVVEGAIGRIQSAASDAVDCLKRNLDAAKPADQIRAALGILDHAIRGIELTDLIVRVEELERQLAGEGQDESDVLPLDGPALALVEPDSDPEGPPA